MPGKTYRPPFIRSIQVNASPEEVFAYVSDLTRHGEWGGGPLSVRAVTPDPVAVGSQYRSVGRMKGLFGLQPPKDFHAELTVVEYQPPSRFAFIARDEAGEFLNEFTLRPQGGGTLVERNTTIEIPSLAMLLLSKLFIRPFFAVPMTDRSLRRLKARLEQEQAAREPTAARA